ncbi:pyrroloquinoline quinone biosynthesis protein PqqF [Pseudomonas sp. GD03860]|uniref:pyrroloquinoline quinone biosynthesis protein PqqF n=1 Tax=Pseudomonas TaxID=286 RepID=UPI0023637682|nr:MULTISPECIES: pyrroloquinoline quinone biosynthesis protein PqqF [Pseudomonas]MDD2059257.1 pyrroloquinoline quinone biosynthesis protein PqqF [Pseudomonas putida]MDH0636796.1 pyrroloquinoline quinone biosynthesis protein PqqF [Pseudomonas sp. GD03860]
MPTALRHLTLDNGLQVTLRHAPQLKRCAAAVRVMAGSHDAPRAFAGLAHFLEHLLFLGNERFPLDDGLMRYVQRHGGQVNASTRERTTDYFFEVPQAAFAGGLERLCEMLARPSFERAAQAREREVIHAEFIAWSRNAQAQAQFALLQAVSKRHPLSGFQAGNRYSLPIHSAYFQVALQGFHQRFYQAGQMTLSLCGPQSLDVLQTLANSIASQIAVGAKVAQHPPPALAAHALEPVLNGSQLELLQAVEQLPAGADQAIDFLTTWLTDTRPGGLLAALRERGWAHAIECSALYSFAGQALLHTRLMLSDPAVVDPAQVLLLDWLRFLRGADWTALNAEYAGLQRCRSQAATALDLARRDSTAQPFAALTEQGQAALRSLLDTLLLGARPTRRHAWQLPAREPLLNPQSLDTNACAAPVGLTWSPILPALRQQGVVYLRWQLTSALRDRLWHVLDRALQPLRERAARAAVELQFNTASEFWQVRCAGVPVAVIVVVNELLEILPRPSAASWRAEATVEPDSMPIRALIKQLPEQLAGPSQGPLPACTLSQGDLDALWLHATWQAMAIGFDEPAQQALNRVLQAVPGQPGAQRAVAIEPIRRWQRLPPPASEQALLLFCALPASDEACARLLAQQIQGPFYQRLRVELQLGYAVFSAYRQLQGCSGLVFGVQSPSASHAQILTHIEEFLATLPGSLTCTAESRKALAEQWEEASMSNADVAEWAWQAHLAGRPGVRLEDLQASILSIHEDQLRQLVDDLQRATHGWLCLANGPAATEDWVMADPLLPNM